MTTTKDLHTSIGVLKYEHIDGYGYKLYVTVDPGISAFYRSLIPKWETVNLPRYYPHITVVRKETPKKLDIWGKYQDKRIAFTYCSDIKCNTVYWYLDVFSTELEQIRLELGLPISSVYTRPPDGYSHCFHTTIGNKKELK